MVSDSIEKITSKDNSKLKLARSLHSKSTRDEQGLFILEGETLIRDALSSGIEVQKVFISLNKLESVKELLDAARDEIELIEISEELMKGIATTSSAPPLLAIAKKPKLESKANKVITTANKILFCENIQDPGNLGGIMRSAFASGVELLCLSENCVDIYNPKSIRSSMGALFKGKVQIVKLTDLKKNLPEHKIIATSSYAERSYKDLEEIEKFILLVGNEANGLSPEALSLADIQVKIPMQNNIESLNVVTAASLILFELS